MADYIGTSGGDDFAGTSDIDLFTMTQGGKDTVSAGGGNDQIDFGATLTAADRIDGGDGFDIMSIEGDYSEGLTLGANTLHGIERIQFLAGFDYRLTLVDGNIDPTTRLDLSNDHGAKSIWVDASAVVNGGSVYTYSNRPNTIIGSQSGDQFQEFTSQFNLDGQAGDDLVQAFTGMNRSSRFDGGDGVDTLGLYATSIATITGKMIRHVETLSLGEAIDITFANGNVDKDATMTVNLSAASRVDASAEIDGHFVINGSIEADTLIGGRGADTLSGGAAVDQLTGGRGADVLTGGDGGDSFIFARTADSTKKAADLIADFGASEDHIDLSQIDARTDKDGDQAFHLVAKFTHAAGELTFKFDADANVTKVQGDVNGDGRADLVFEVSGHLTDATSFIL